MRLLEKQPVRLVEGICARLGAHPDRGAVAGVRAASALRSEGRRQALGSGFGADGEGYVRFALVENEERIRQAAHSIGRAL